MRTCWQASDGEVAQANRVWDQRLLIPEPIELPAHQAALVLERRADLAERGLEGEDFGSTVLLHSYPAVLGKNPPR